MRGDASKRQRAVEVIEHEFDGMLLQHWSPDIARRRFEVLWDEVNVAATKTLGRDAGCAYIALLSCMQYEFDKQYRGVPLLAVNGTGHEIRYPGHVFELSCERPQHRSAWLCIAVMPPDQRAP